MKTNTTYEVRYTGKKTIIVRDLFGKVYRKFKKGALVYRGTWSGFARCLIPGGGFNYVVIAGHGLDFGATLNDVEVRKITYTTETIVRRTEVEKITI
jgi:hypothetical protein